MESRLRCDVSQAVASVGHHPLRGYWDWKGMRAAKLLAGLRTPNDSQLLSGTASAPPLSRDGHVGGSDVAAQPEKISVKTCCHAQGILPTPAQALVVTISRRLHWLCPDGPAKAFA